MFSSRVSGSGEVCGRAPRAISGAALRRVSRTASDMSSRSNIAMNVTGRPLAASSNSSTSYCSSSSTAIWRVSATSIAPFFFAFSTPAYARSSSGLALRQASGRPP